MIALQGMRDVKVYQCPIISIRSETLQTDQGPQKSQNKKERKKERRKERKKERKSNSLMLFVSLNQRYVRYFFGICEI